MLDVIGTLARLGLAAVWLVSGGIKAADPGQTYVAVRAYDVLPPGRGRAGGRGAAVAGDRARPCCCWSGWACGRSRRSSARLLLVFVAGIVQAWARGLAIDCGCFGGGGAVDPDATAYGLELAPRHRVPGARGAGWWFGRATLVALDGLLIEDDGMSGGARNEKQRQQAERAARLAAAGITRAGAPTRQEPGAADRRRRWCWWLVVIVAGGWYYLSRPGGHADVHGHRVRRRRHRGQRARSSSTSTRTSSARAASRWRSATADEIDQALNDGRITVKYHCSASSTHRPTPSATPRAPPTRRSARPAGIHPAYHQSLFAEQPAEGSAGLTDDQLVAFGTELGADLGACITGGANTDAVTAMTRAAVDDPALRNADGNFGTPTVLLDGARVDISDTGWLQKALGA